MSNKSAPDFRLRATEVFVLNTVTRNGGKLSSVFWTAGQARYTAKHSHRTPRVFRSVVEWEELDPETFEVIE